MNINTAHGTAQAGPSRLHVPLEAHGCNSAAQCPTTVPGAFPGFQTVGELDEPMTLDRSRSRSWSKISVDRH